MYLRIIILVLVIFPGCDSNAGEGKELLIPVAGSSSPDKSAGESQVEWQGQEFIQSPYVAKHNGTWFMYYGGYDSGLDRFGNPADAAANYDRSEKQIT